MEQRLSADQQGLAEHWFGYGRWEAPFWFVGIEPGGDELDECVRTWNALGRGELLDIASHHENHKQDWFSEGSPTQPTWAKLIWLLLAFKNEEPNRLSTREYQHQQLGRSMGETALIEISSLPAKNRGVDVPRELFRRKRAQLIATRVSEFSPRFVVLYSPDPEYAESWKIIAGTALQRDRPVAVGRTAVVMTYHPNGKWARSYWIAMGQFLRAFSETLLDDRSDARSIGKPHTIA